MDLNRASELTPEIEKAVEEMFEYQPWNEEQIAKGKIVRAVLCDAVKMIIKHVPPGPDRTVAIRKVREARMDVNSALTFGGRY